GPARLPRVRAQGPTDRSLVCRWTWKSKSTRSITLAANCANCLPKIRRRNPNADKRRNADRARAPPRRKRSAEAEQARRLNLDEGEREGRRLGLRARALSRHAIPGAMAEVAHDGRRDQGVYR